MRIQIHGLSDEVAYTDFFKGVKDGSTFKFDLVRKRVSTLYEALMKAEAYIQALELCAIKTPSEYKRSEKQESRPAQPAKKEEKKKKEVWVTDSSGQPSQKRKRSDPHVPKYEFAKDCAFILKEVKDRLNLEKPAAMKSPVSSRDKSKYCHFHEEIGHDTEGCFSLRRLLDRLADEGALKSYLPKSKSTSKQNKGPQPKQTANHSDTDEDTIFTIAGGLAGGGPTIRGTKDNIRRLINSVDDGQTSKSSFPEVHISEKDRGNVRRPHDDPIVVECKIANQRVGRILIDTGSPFDIISYRCLEKLKYKPSNMNQVTYPLVGFGGRVVHPVGIIDLPIRFGEKGLGRHMVVKVLVVEELTAYNLIIGRPTLNISKAVIIPSLMLIKFERDDDTVGSLSGDQKMARECYLSDIKLILTADGQDNVEIPDDCDQEASEVPAPAGKKRKADPLESIKTKQ
ncbi:uncharacterized protein LOC110696506 [Chenopodium quinoa]|uniref:uncharacterized protein LOC110696506 n=1 Tax=Chenopodium quinoa TaxID=63459 RepID=UPI000B7936FB|nr:uncharacterized protein LOC110696506 [Chenopodium quinoa]